LCILAKNTQEYTKNTPRIQKNTKRIQCILGVFLVYSWCILGVFLCILVCILGVFFCILLYSCVVVLRIWDRVRPARACIYQSDSRQRVNNLQCGSSPLHIIHSFVPMNGMSGPPLSCDVLGNRRPMHVKSGPPLSCDHPQERFIAAADRPPEPKRHHPPDCPSPSAHVRTRSSSH
jgi:hypothetical protein